MTLSRRIALFLVAVLTCVFLIWVSSPTVIVPPANPTNSVTVYVVDHGYHSRLVLPDRESGYIQYAYGDWNYFALNQQSWSDAAAALLIPTQGTFGRRKFSNIDNIRRIVDPNRDKTILNFEVAGAKAAQLLKALNERFNRNINTRVENPLNGLSFVQDDQDYSLFHNSNHELVAWLKDLDCEVTGFVMLPNFQVKSSED